MPAVPVPPSASEMPVERVPSRTPQGLRTLFELPLCFLRPTHLRYIPGDLLQFHLLLLPLVV